MKRIPELNSSENFVTDTKPLTDTSAYNTVTDIILTGNPLSDESITIFLPMLEERGVEIIR
jgi:hypothetical protein